MEDSYKFLRIGATVFKVLAWVSIALGAISAVIIFIGGGAPEAPRVTGFLGILVGMIYFFVSFTLSEIITLLLDIRCKLDKGSSV